MPGGNILKYLFIAEKPSVMRQVRDTYNKHKAEIVKKIGEIDFVALSGHICRWEEPSEYAKWKDLKWSEMELPLIPESFVVVRKTDKHSNEVLSNVKETIKKNKYDGLIVGTDSDTEGNGIFYLVAKYLKLENYKTLRFFEKSMTEKEILESLYSMTDFYKNPRDVHMTECFITRSQFDWLVGMNATIGITVKQNELYKVGRVKAPTLKLVYDNSKAIDEFKPHSSYLIKAEYAEGFTSIYSDTDGEPIEYQTEKEALEQIKNFNKNSAVVKKVERKDKSIHAPLLYKLSQLQAEAGALYNYTPDKTLSLVQSLYDKQFVSYPRTDGTYISSEKAKTLPSLLRSANVLPGLHPYLMKITNDIIKKVSTDKRVVNDAKVQESSHDALLPTEVAPDLSTLSKDEVNIYDLICRRLVAQFLPDLVETKTVLFADVDGDLFKSTGSCIKQKGWSELYNRKSNAETIPENIKNGSVLNINKFSPYEKKSVPPKRLTEASLVLAMENIAKYITEKDLKLAMKEAKGIGTQATRAQIISDLIKTGYMESRTNKNLLYITDVGKRYIEALKDFTITDPVQSAKWETMFQGVKNGDIPYPEAKKNTITYVNDFIKEIDNIKAAPVSNHTRSDTGLICPYCGKKIIAYKWGYACEDSMKGCAFKLSSFNGKVKESDVKSLISKGVTREIKNISKSANTGKMFNAALKLSPKGSKYVTSFVFSKK